MRGSTTPLSSDENRSDEQGHFIEIYIGKMFRQPVLINGGKWTLRQKSIWKRSVAVQRRPAVCSRFWVTPTGCCCCAN
ncbi:hypothetical protein PSEUDO9AG_50579 [Pseudomonas sp. 9Ag]|nr:hypothetical protein PSEUDO9AG_50579 [Pseudomonas sp. 9Ag]